MLLRMHCASAAYVMHAGRHHMQPSGRSGWPLLQSPSLTPRMHACMRGLRRVCLLGAWRMARRTFLLPNCMQVLARVCMHACGLEGWEGAGGGHARAYVPDACPCLTILPFPPLAPSRQPLPAPFPPPPSNPYAPRSPPPTRPLPSTPPNHHHLRPPPGLRLLHPHRQGPVGQRRGEAGSSTLPGPWKVCEVPLRMRIAAVVVPVDEALASGPGGGEAGRRGGAGKPVTVTVPPWPGSHTSRLSAA